MGVYAYRCARLPVSLYCLRLQVVDHASRVPTSSKKRILGILLGQNEGKTINVANSCVWSMGDELAGQSALTQAG